MHRFRATAPYLRRNTEMKYLLRVLFILALSCGFACHSHAQGFHAQVLDPSCNATLTECGLGVDDIGKAFPVTLSLAQCTGHFTPLPTGSDFGCFFGSNETGAAITSFTLDFAAIPEITGCDTDITGTTPGPAFTVSQCVVDSEGGFGLTFSGGSIADGFSFVILEEGVDPRLFTGTVTANPVPEPDSLLLLATGTMMVGLYFAGRQRLFASLKK